jgi:hypothetical protein
MRRERLRAALLVSAFIWLAAPRSAGSHPVARFEETAARLAPAGAWAEIGSADIGVTLSGDRAVFASAAGATATFTFTGTEVSWIGLPCEVCGIANVHVDGVVVDTVDTFAPTPPAVSEVMFTVGGLAATSHTLVIEVTGTANASSGGAAIVVDAFDVKNEVSPGPAPSETTPPAVTMTAPSDGATVAGTVTVAARASDDTGVAGVQFLVDGVVLGMEDTRAPFEVSWDTRTVPDGPHTLAARARDTPGNVATSAPVTVTVANGPGAVARFEETAAGLAPAGAWAEIGSADIGVTLSGDRAVFGSAAGATATFTFTGTEVSWIGLPCEVCGIANVHVDGVVVDTVDTFAATRPAVSGVMFTVGGLAATSHTLVIEVTGTANASSGDAVIVVDAFDVRSEGAGPPPSETTPPTVVMTAPSDGATVAGTVTVTARASDDTGVAGVQFLVDGVALGMEDTRAPFEVSWDTQTVPDGPHTLTARARDTAGNVATSAPVTVTVANGPGAVARFEETAAGLAPAGAWAEIGSADIGVTLSGDRAVFGSAAGATATFTFTGTEVSWIGLPCEVCGIANVHVDGVVVDTVDTFAPTRPAVSEVMFTVSGLAATSHTLVIEVTGTANASSGDAAIVVDAFDVTR